jgi:hypothetical protein
MADTLGLTEALSAAMAPTKVRGGGHDRGDVVVDLAVMLADGGETISDKRRFFHHRYALQCTATLGQERLTGERTMLLHEVEIIQPRA